MEFREFLTHAAEFWIERNEHHSSGSLKMKLTDKELEGFLEAASSRTIEDPIWHQMDELLGSLQLQYPVKATRMRSDIKWLRKQAKKRGYPWGRR